MSTMLTGKGILDSTAAMLTDSSAGTRTKMLVWLNVLVQKLSADRIDWDWLRKTVLGTTITLNQITVPADFQRVINISKSGMWYLESEQLTDLEAFAFSIATAGDSTPTGYYVSYSAGTITLYPSATGVCNLVYLAEHPAIADSTATMLFPIQFQPVLMRGCLDFFYEFDMDLRAASSYQLDSKLMEDLYASELSGRPIPRIEAHGYVRRNL